MSDTANTRFPVEKQHGSLWLAFVVCLLIGTGALAQRAERPNILFFFVDDMGWQDTSEPFWKDVTPLNKRYRTPNMERLARQGMKFTQAYATPVCSPSRISLMTGMNAARHKVTNWTLYKDWTPDKEHPTLEMPTWNCNGLSQRPGVTRTVVTKTLPALLQEAGYWTIHVGKAHFAADGTPSEDPKALGFDVNIAGHAAGAPGSYQGLRNFKRGFKRNKDGVTDVPGLDAYHGRDIHLTEALTLEAIKALDTAIDAKKPFYLYMSHYAIHGPWEPDSRFIKNYRTDLPPGKPGKIRKRYEDYASMIEGMDKSLGDLMNHLQKRKVDHNTVVVFMSDNGAEGLVPANRPLRGHKHNPYEGGIRVPLLVKWPGVTKPDSVCLDAYVIIEDIFPTFLELAGVTDYRQPGDTIDGRSFAHLLKRKRGKEDARAIFWHSPHFYMKQPPFSAVRQGDWKLIYHHAEQRLELFNISSDISEAKDLAQAHPDRVAELARVLGDHLRAVGGQMPVVKATNKSVPYPDQSVRLRQ